MTLRTINRRMQYILSTGFICVISAACFLFRDYVSADAVAFVLLFALSITAMFFDILPVLLSAILSALIWDYYFLLPRFSFTPANAEEIMMLISYFVIALLNAFFTSKIRKAEKMARQKEERIENLRLYNTLFNSLSHEIRTPLATIIGATDNLLNFPTVLSPEMNRSLVTEISNASLRLNRQVDNLLNMSRLESGFIRVVKDWCSIPELIEAVLERLDNLIQDFTIEVNIPDNFPLFKLDFGLMEQVLYNLFFNACLYTPEKSLIRINATFDDECLFIIVEDEGPGFPEDEIEKVFGKFYRLKDSPAGGTGLGLSIVRGFVEAHGGTVALRNLNPGGARFTICIKTEKLYNLADEISKP